MESLKEEIFGTIACATLREGLTQNSVIILTPTGVISGKPYNGETDLPHRIIPDLAADAVRSRAPGIDAGGYVVLSDVTVRNNTGKCLSFDSLVVFCDQIVGITIGKID